MGKLIYIVSEVYVVYMVVDLELLDSHETPDNSDDMVLLTDGMAYIEFHITSDEGTVDSYEFDLQVTPECDDTFSIVNSSTNEQLPTQIPRIHMPTPIIVRVATVFKLSDEQVLSERDIKFTLHDDTGAEVATETVVFTELVDK